jgi:hypothetical protein
VAQFWISVFTVKSPSRARLGYAAVLTTHCSVARTREGGALPARIGVAVLLNGEGALFGHVRDDGADPYSENRSAHHHNNRRSLVNRRLPTTVQVSTGSALHRIVICANHGIDFEPTGHADQDWMVEQRGFLTTGPYVATVLFFTFRATARRASAELAVPVDEAMRRVPIPAYGLLRRS